MTAGPPDTSPEDVTDAGPRRLTEEQRALASEPRYLNWAEVIANGWAKRLPRLADEINSAAYAGLVDAARKFDPSRGLAFTTYSKRRIIGAIRDQLRDLGTRGFKDDADSAPSLVSLHEQPAPGFPSYAALLADDAEPPWAAEEAAEAVLSLTRALPRKHRRAMRLFYLDASARTTHEVVAKMGISQARVSVLINQGIDMIRDGLSANGVTSIGELNEPRPRRRTGGFRAKHDHALILRMMAENPTWSDYTIAEQYEAETGTKIAPANVYYVLKSKRPKAATPSAPAVSEPVEVPLALPADPVVDVAPPPIVRPKAILVKPEPPALVAPTPVPAPAPPTPPPGSPLLAEIDAMRSVALAVHGLDRHVARRVLAAVGSMLEPAGA